MRLHFVMTIVCNLRFTEADGIFILFATFLITRPLAVAPSIMKCGNEVHTPSRSEILNGFSGRTS